MVTTTATSINIPSNTEVFVDNIGNMGSTDPTGTKKKTMELVTMREQPALSERFESAGFESLNFIYNSSSFIQWIAIISF